MVRKDIRCHREQLGQTQRTLMGGGLKAAEEEEEEEAEEEEAEEAEEEEAEEEEAEEEEEKEGAYVAAIDRTTGYLQNHRKRIF